MSDKPKVETVEEFLARGGKITVIPPVPHETDNKVHPTTSAAAPMMSLDEGAHFFSEVKKRQHEKKKDLLKEVDVSKLPADIRKLFNL